MIDDHDVLTDVLDEVELVAREQDGDAFRCRLLQQLGERLDAERIQAAERLVQHHELGVVDKSSGELDPLLVPV